VALWLEAAGGSLLIRRQHGGGRGVTQLHRLQAAIFACSSAVVYYCVRARMRLMAEDGSDGDEMSCSVCQALVRHGKFITTLVFEAAE
jgi:hypothetical protein